MFSNSNHVHNTNPKINLIPMAIQLMDGTGWLEMFSKRNIS